MALQNRQHEMLHGQYQGVFFLVLLVGHSIGNFNSPTRILKISIPYRDHDERHQKNK